MRNSVKATVDAYDGTVTLYAWDDDRPDPEGLGGRVPRRGASRSPTIPPDLLRAPALPRGPVQGAALPARALPRHRPEDFYDGNDQWEVPEDPDDHGQQAAAVPAVGARRRPAATTPVFSLTACSCRTKKQNLAAFMSVDADAADPNDYGKIRILRLPEQHPGPGPVADRQPVRRRQQASRTSCCAFKQTDAKVDLRQPAHAAGRRTGCSTCSRSTRCARPAQGRYPVLQLRAGVVRREGRHRHDAAGGARRRARRRPAPSDAARRATPAAPGRPGRARRCRATCCSCCSRPTRSSREAQQALKAGDLQGYAKAQARRATLVQQALAAARPGNREAPRRRRPRAPSPSAPRRRRRTALARIDDGVASHG